MTLGEICYIVLAVYVGVGALWVTIDSIRWDLSEFTVFDYFVATVIWPIHFLGGKDQ